ncbi:MAG: hypothetical protein ACTSQP_17285 [Promethearchaeota archaeon]
MSEVNDSQINYVLIVIFSFFYIIGVVAYRIITNWEYLILDPLTYGWDFFFALLILDFFISLMLFEKKEVLILSFSSLVALFWEAFVEVFGWYYKLWEFAKHETEIEVVIPLALQLGLEFYAFYYLIGIFYLLLYKSELKYKNFYIGLILITLTIGGWQGDLHIAKFDTIYLTFFVWLILNSLHLLALIKLQKVFLKEDILE